MPIRYKCQDCGSVLKIKDELAGTDGRCPKCKLDFLVPAVTDSDEAADGDSGPNADDGDFDPVAFLMDGPKSGASPAPAATESRPRTGQATESESEPPKSERRKKLRVPSTGTAAETADAMLGRDASSNAKQLLTRSMEESRVRAAEMPEEPEEPEVDYSEFGKLLLTRILPIGVAVVLLCFALHAWSSSWFSEDLPDLGRVSGTVTRSGEPLAGAQITFAPLDVRASSATAITDDQGNYELQYQEGVEGAVVGKNRVVVFALDERGREVIEADTPYGAGSNEIWVVTSGSQRIDIDTDKPAPPVAAAEE